MLETSEQIIAALSYGETLEFEQFSIKGFPGFEISMLYKGEQSVYQSEIQDFEFQVSMADVYTNEVTLGMTFNYTISPYVYTFELKDNPKPDLVGWARLTVNLKSREEV